MTVDVASQIRRHQFEQRFIDPDVLTGLGSLSLVAKTVVEGFISGLHRSPYHGFSVDFAEYRAYTPGDDIRTIDWKVYGRSDRFYVKKYEGETNTQVFLVLDCSRSMTFASTRLSKLDYGRFLASSLAFMAQRQKDAVGLVTFDSTVQHFTPARIRRGQYQTLLHHLEEAKAGSRTDIRQALAELASHVRKRSLIIVISDFYQQPQQIGKALKFFALNGSDLVLFHLLDPVELKLPFSSVSTLEDIESQDCLPYAPESGNAYRQALEAHIESLRKQCNDVNIDYELVNTEEPLDQVLYRYLTARARHY